MQDLTLFSVIFCEWFEQELAAIRSRRFHIFEVTKSKDLQYDGPLGSAILTGDFAEFLSKFGRAMLFTDHGDGANMQFIN